MPESSTPPNSSELRTKRIEAISSLIKSIAWPLIVLVFFCFNCNSIKKVFDEIPQKFKDSDKVTIGSLSLEITQKANQLGDPQLGELTKGLSSKAIEELLTTGNLHMAWSGGGMSSDNITLPSGNKKAALEELYKKELLSFRIPYEQYEKRIQDLKLTVDNEHYTDEDRTNYKLSVDQRKELAYIQSQGYNLSDKGRQVFALVIDAVGSNLKGQKTAKEEQ